MFLVYSYKLFDKLNYVSEGSMVLFLIYLGVDSDLFDIILELYVIFKRKW